jgi:hypothetical protein
MTYYLKSAGNFSNDLLKHIALLGRKHINCLEIYLFNKINVLENEELRPLNIGYYRTTGLTEVPLQKIRAFYKIIENLHNKAI